MNTDDEKHLFQKIMAQLDKQSMLFIDTADQLTRIARETVVRARLPNFHIPAAIEVLTTGTYSRVPSCVKVTGDQNIFYLCTLKEV